MEKTTISLKDVWTEFRQKNPKIRIREAARILGVSEAELVATGEGETAIRLEGDFRELLKRAGSLGKVMALTRNEFCVHERKGTYEKVSFSSHAGLALGPDIDLRLFMNRWKSGFAVSENGRRSFQFFDGEGTAVHKIYLTENSDEAAYQRLVEQYRSPEQGRPLSVTTTAPKKDSDEPLSPSAIGEFQRAWLELEDTHDFFGLLRKYKLNREKAMHIAPEGHSIEINREILRAVFEKAAAQNLSIMVFTGSPGCVQIHTGLVRRLVVTGPWFNILDPDFNLHLREDGIRSVWVVRKPTKDGIVSGIEVFDREGGLILQLFGKRKPGIPEDSRWRALVEGLLLATGSAPK